MFNLVIDDPPSANDRLIFPISMNQRYHTGERLAALIRLASGYNSTLLIADALQRHNLRGNEAKAITLGTKFIDKHNALLSSAITINTAEEWNNAKDSSQLKIIRWKTWGAIQSAQLARATQLVDEKYHQHSELFQAIQQTAQESWSAVSKESSVAYQREEIAYMLTFHDFTIHVYPTELNASQLVAKATFAHCNIPRLITPTTVRSPIISDNDQALFSQHLKQRHRKSLPLAARILINNAEAVLNSPEISPAHQAATIEALSMLIHSRGKAALPASTDHPSTPQ